MALAPLYDVSLCPCCLVWLANDDDSGCRDYHRCTRGTPEAPVPDADHPSGLMGALTLRAGEVCVPGDADDTHFSKSPCDGCGSTWHGDRSPAVVIGPDLPQDHYPEHEND